jgi:hypothetical protein
LQATARAAFDDEGVIDAQRFSAWIARGFRFVRGAQR